jgi:hypothetical protein
MIDDDDDNDDDDDDDDDNDDDDNDDDNEVPETSNGRVVLRLDTEKLEYVFSQFMKILLDCFPEYPDFCPCLKNVFNERDAFVANCLRGAAPPVDLRAVCFVRAMSIYIIIQMRINFYL